jgi:hypothetical protein
VNAEGVKSVEAALLMLHFFALCFGSDVVFLWDLGAT